MEGLSINKKKGKLMDIDNRVVIVGVRRVLAGGEEGIEG